MATTEAETVQDVDEALVFMSAELYAARCIGNAERAEVVLRYVDKTLDRRFEIAPVKR